VAFLRAGDPEVGRQPSKLNERFRIPPSAPCAADSDSDVPWTPSKECGCDTRRPLHVVVRECGSPSAKRRARARLPPTTPRARPGGTRRRSSKPLRTGFDSPRALRARSAVQWAEMCPASRVLRGWLFSLSRRNRARPSEGRWSRSDSEQRDCRASGRLLASGPSADATNVGCARSIRAEETAGQVRKPGRSHKPAHRRSTRRPATAAPSGRCPSFHTRPGEGSSPSAATLAPVAWRASGPTSRRTRFDSVRGYAGASRRGAR
jgi:hypothetical protein